MSLGPTLHRLRYFCTDAWDEWRHSPWVNLLAMGTLVAVLFLAGLIMLVLFNVTMRVEKLRSDIRVEVYLWDSITNTASPTRPKVRYSRAKMMIRVKGTTCSRRSLARSMYSYWPDQVIE